MVDHGADVHVRTNAARDVLLRRVQNGAFLFGTRHTVYVLLTVKELDVNNMVRAST